jgi:hypothetical protein
MKNLMTICFALLTITLVTNTYAAKNADGEKIDLTVIEARLAVLEDGVKTRADGGIYMVTQTEVGLNGNCMVPGAGISHQAIRGWALMFPTEDSNRMDLFLNYDNTGNSGAGSLSSFRSDFEISGGVITEDGVRQQNDGIAPATVFISSGEITLDPDTTTPWEPAGELRPPHYNNQAIWGAMSDDGSMFTIVAHLITDEAGNGSDCDRASLITVTGARLRTN